MLSPYTSSPNSVSSGKPINSPSFQLGQYNVDCACAGDRETLKRDCAMAGTAFKYYLLQTFLFGVRFFFCGSVGWSALVNLWFVHHGTGSIMQQVPMMLHIPTFPSLSCRSVQLKAKRSTNYSISRYGDIKSYSYFCFVSPKYHLFTWATSRKQKP